MKNNSIIFRLFTTASILISSCTTQTGPLFFLQGYWSSEGEITSLHYTRVEIDQQANNFEGIIRHEELGRFSDDIHYSTGMARISNGLIVGNTASFDIYSQRGANIGTGQLVSSGRNLGYTIKIKGRGACSGTMWPTNGQ